MKTRTKCLRMWKWVSCGQEIGALYSKKRRKEEGMDVDEDNSEA